MCRDTCMLYFLRALLTSQVIVAVTVDKNKLKMRKENRKLVLERVKH